MSQVLPSIEEHQHLYAAATYRVMGPDGQRYDLRLGARSAQPAEPWAIVTAANPCSVQLSSARNALRNRSLEARLRARGLRWGWGDCVPDDRRAARVPVYLVLGVPVLEARALAARAGQVGVLVGGAGAEARLERGVSYNHAQVAGGYLAGRFRAGLEQLPADGNLEAWVHAGECGALQSFSIALAVSALFAGAIRRHAPRHREDWARVCPSTMELHARGRPGVARPQRALCGVFPGCREARVTAESAFRNCLRWFAARLVSVVGAPLARQIVSNFAHNDDLRDWSGCEVTTGARALWVDALWVATEVVRAI